MKLLAKCKWQKWRFGVYGLFALAAIFTLWPFCFTYDSVCSQCGAIKETIEWQLPHREFTFFTYSYIEQPPLSRYLTSSSVGGAHSHDWLFGHGGGNGIKCALGDGDSITATVTSPEVVRLLAFSRQFGGQQESSNLLKYIFNRDISRAVLSLAESVPTNGFATRDQYQSWLADHNFLIQDAVEYSKENR